ncbi:MAG: amino acid adenylation domain-containing protein, partial [bacterium]|nr:amino acid adenylation domain-containing protein [bacterium]
MTENAGYTEENLSGDEIAVIGMAGRFPGAVDIHRFWDNLKNGVESISFPTQPELEQVGYDDEVTKRAGFVKTKGGVVSGKEYFDASFFGYTPHEAEIMDPKIRLFYQSAWEALESAGYEAGSYPGMIGLYAGANLDFTWKAMVRFSNRQTMLTPFATSLLTGENFLVSNVSYTLNLKGPAVFVQTACSTSLVAIHMACQGILDGEADMALAGGVSLRVREETGYLYQEGGVQSSDGHCRAFDAGASGTAGGEGVGVVVLKNIQKALEDRDPVLALIKGSAVNNDGNRKPGFTAPSVTGQKQVIQLAHLLADVEPQSITYVEAHGSGTALGDPIEVEALTQAFDTDQKKFCGIGTVKTNIGHLDAAAGVAGFIKTVLALQHKTIPPSLHFQTPNPRIDFENSPFYVNTRLTPWENNGHPLRAGVSSFGIGGTNAHIVLEEWPGTDDAPADDSEIPARPCHLLLLSAKTQTALDKMTANLAIYLKNNPTNLPDVSYTLQKGRKRFQYRRKLVCADIPEAIQCLTSEDRDSRNLQTFRAEKEEQSIPVVFLFPGLGSQYVNMGLGLYETEPLFRETMDRCFGILKPLLDYDPGEILYPSSSAAPSPVNINQIETSQLAVFIFGYSLAILIMEWGIHPRAMIGYSFGEYIAACISGVFSLQDALKLLVVRGQLLREVPGGAMLSVPLTASEVRPFLEGNDQLALGIDNGFSCVVSGTEEAVKIFESRMKGQRLVCMRLDTGHALHSPMMDAISDRFEKEVAALQLTPPRVPYISTVTGTWIKTSDAVSPGYWRRQLRQPVQFDAGLRLLLEEEENVFIEVGAGRDISAMVRRRVDDAETENPRSRHQVVNLSPQRPTSASAGDSRYLTDRLGLMWLYGVSIDWTRYWGEEKRRRVFLPTYPFEKQEYRQLIREFESGKFEGFRARPVSARDPREESEVHKVEDNKTEYSAPLYSRPQLSNPYIAPRTHLERRLCEIWQSFFGIRQVGVTDDLFDLGGDSLKATNILSIIEKEFQVSIPIKEFFDHSTIEAAARYIDAAETSEFLDIEPAEKKDYYPLSSAQKRLYFLQQMDKTSIAYNGPQAVELQGDLRRRDMETAFRELILRHEVLRTSLRMRGEEAVQVVHDVHGIDFRMEHYDLSSNSAGNGKEEHYSRAINAFIRPFDLSRPPFLRAALITASEHRHILVVDLHHIVTDGISHDIFVTQFMALYSGETLPFPHLQYKDYARWQAGSRQRGLLAKQEEFWLEHFRGPIPQLNLPIDYARPPVQDFSGSTVPFQFSEETTRQLKELAAAEGVTLFMLLLAIYDALLFKMTRQQDIIVSTGVAGRGHPDLRSIMGIFVNTLAFRSYPVNPKTFRQFLAEIKETTLQAFENQEYPFEDLVEKLEIKRDTSRNPLFDTMMVFQNYHAQAPVELSQQQHTPAAKPYRFDRKIAKFDLTLFGDETYGNRLSFLFEYSTRLFKPQTIGTFITYFKEIARSVASNPGLTLSRIVSMPGERREAIVYQLNHQLREEAANFDETISARTLQQMVDDSLRAFHANTAIQHGPNGSQTLTYRQLDRESHRVAQWILYRGIPPQTPIGILMEDRVSVIVALTGVLKARCIFVPLDSSYPQSRLESMKATAGITVMITDLGTLDFEGETIGKERQASPDDAVYVYFTSGTTGTPRAMLGRDRSLLHFIHWETDTFNVDQTSRISQLTAPVFDAFLRDIFTPLCAGATICIPPAKETFQDAQQLSRWTDRSGITLMHCVPAVFRLLASPEYLNKDLLKSLNTILLSGEPIHPTDLVQWFGIMGDRVSLVNLWGTSETTLAKTFHIIRREDLKRERIPVGAPLPGARVVVLDEHLEPCDPSVTGELYIKTPFSTFGYLNDSRSNSLRFIPDPFHQSAPGSHLPLTLHLRLHKTGDLGRISPDGHIDVLGRNDRQVKIRGIRVELEEIETIIMKNPAVREAAALKTPASVPNGIQLLCVWVVLHTADITGVTDISDIKAEISRQVPSYMVPDRLVKLETMPRKPGGKIDYDALPDPLAEEKTAVQPPRDHVERKLTQLWSVILGIEGTGISVNRSFFETGGNSLNIMTLISRVHKAFDVRISLGDMFNNPTIEKQAALVRSARPDRFAAIRPVEEREYYELSPAQKRLYLLHRMEPQSTGYNMTQAVTLEGGWEAQRLGQVFDRLIRRYESLRTSFFMLSGRPVQRIRPGVEFEVESREYGVGSIETFIRPFDLEHAPQFRAGVMEAAEGRLILVTDIHHIISDGVSQQLLIKAFTDLYHGKELTPSRLRIQYRDFAHWQVAMLTRPEGQGPGSRQKDYWLKQLQGEIPLLSLPYDFPRPPVQSFEGSISRFHIEEEERRALQALAVGEGVTLYMVLLTFFHILLSKLSGQQDIIVGTPVAGRGHADLHGIIGMFVNTLVIRDYPGDSLTFQQLLQQIKITTLDAFENQDYPFEELVEQVAVNRDPGRNPLFDAVFSMHNNSLDHHEHGQAATGPELPVPGNTTGLRASTHQYEITISKFDLTLHAFEVPSGISFSFEYCTRLFKEETIQWFALYYKRIASLLMENSRLRLGEIELITHEERRDWLVRFNDTQAQWPEAKTIHQLFEEQVTRTPEQIAVVNPEDRSSVTYVELNEKSNRLAARLMEKGVASGTIVAIMTEPSVEMMIGLLGILKAGGAYLPIDPDYPDERVEFMLKDSGAKNVVGNGLMVKNLDDTDQLYNQQTIKPSNLVYIIYTSGTTGKPKGMMIEHRNIVRLLFNDKFQFDFNAGDVWSLFHSFCFDFSVWEMYGALLYGGQLTVIPKMAAKDPGQFLEILKTRKVTVLNQTPSAFYRLVEEELKQSGEQLNIRYVIFGGEALKPAKLRGWRDRYPSVKLVNMYGITETTVHVTYKEIGEQEINIGISNIGTPIPTLTVFVMSPALKLQPVGVPGQYCVGGAGVGRGYLNRPGLTAEKFVDNPYKPGERLYLSGDLVRGMSNGEMEYLGRIDHQVKIRGYRVELGEIENRLLRQGSVVLKDVLVTANQDDHSDQYLCAYVVPAVGEDEGEVLGLRDELSQQLPAYMVPSYFVVLPELPLTANSKIDKTALPHPRTGAGGMGKEYVAPQDGLEQQLAAIWQRVLELERVSIKDDFFFLGGDSIKALRLVSAINDEMNCDLKLIDLYTSGTVEMLSQQIRGGGDKDSRTQTMQYTREVMTRIDHLKVEVLQELQQDEEYEDVYPMSDIEKGLVFYYLKHIGTGVYHDQFVYPGKYRSFDLKRFERALKLMVDKHPILRTGFNIEDFDEPVQIVREHISPNFDHRDISVLNVVEQEECIREFLKQDLETPFRIEDTSLWRMRVYTRDPDTIAVVLVFHHAVLDGWSTASLMSELNNTYLKLKREPGFVSSPLGCSYKDTVIDEILEKTNPRTMDYWKNQLTGYKRVEFTETVKEYAPTVNMKVYRTHADAAVLDNLKEVAGSYTTSLKNLCFGAYLFVMDMLTHQEDLVVGVVTNNRPVHEDGDKVLGCFLNTIPVRMQIPTGITWAGYIKMVETKMLEVRRYERLSLFEIARIIGEKNKDRNPIFDTLLNFTDFHIYRDVETEVVPESERSQPREPESAAVKGLNIEGSQITNTLFDFEVSITMGGFVIHPKYNPSAVSEEIVQKSCVYFERVLNKFIHEPDTPMTANDILSPEEIQQLLVQFNDTAADYSREKTIHGLFEEQAERTPYKTALTGGNPNIEIRNPTHNSVHLTYGELNRRTNQLSHGLREKGVAVGDLVAVIMDRSIDMVIVVMSILKAGGAYVPLEPYLPDTRIQKILDSLRVNVLLTDDSEYPRVSGIGESLETLETIWCPGGRDREEMVKYSIKNPSSNVAPLDFAYTIFTSGSTGVPKGVLETHRPVVNVLEWVNRTFDVEPPDKLLFVASLGFDLSVYDIFGILASGACLRVVEAHDIKSPERLLEIIIGEGITFWDSAPAALQQLVPFLDDVADRGERHAMRLVFLSGDWIPVTLPDVLKEAFPGVRVISLGGATEATIWSNFHPILDVDPRWPSIPYGKPIQNAKYYILDRHLELCPIRVPGDLYIGGQCLASGYLNDPELTAEKFIGFIEPQITQKKDFNNKPSAKSAAKLYKTGDIARWHGNGNMEFLGRKDHQVKVRGFRIELGEIESQLLTHDEIKSVVVLLRKDKRGDNFLCAYVVSFLEMSKEKLTDHLSRELPEYMIPMHFIRLEAIPVTANGKVDRKALPAPEAKGDETGLLVLPGNEVQEKLAGVWTEVLGIEIGTIGIDSDFFELGGHSLNATMVISRIHKELDVKIPLAELFNSPTIRGLSKHIGGMEEERYSPLEAVEEREHYPLSSAQMRLFILQQLDNESTAYNGPQVMVLEGELHKERLVKVFNQLIRRHESFRTFFELIGEEPVQRIRQPHEVTFEIQWYGDAPRVERPGEEHESKDAYEKITRDFIRPFDLGKAPLLRVGLVKSGESKHLFMIDIHHIITDGISQEILVREFVLLNTNDGDTTVLPPLTLQYRDFSQWQNGETQRTVLTKQERYWLNQFHGFIPVLNLPVDYARPSFQSFDGDIVSFRLGKEETSDLKEMASTGGATLYMILLTLFKVFLYKVTGQEDIVVGTGVAGRRHADLQNIIGIFVNTLALRNSLSGEKSFLDFLKEVKESTLEAFENQEYPFEDLVEKVMANRDPSRNPLFDTMFQLENIQLQSQSATPPTSADVTTGMKMNKQMSKKIPGDGGSHNLGVKPYGFNRGISKFELTLFGKEAAGGVNFLFEYSTTLFRPETINGFISYFKEIAVSAASDPGKPISRIVEIPAKRKEELAYRLNDRLQEELKTFNTAFGNQTLQRLLKESFEAFGNNTAIEFGRRTVTYDELDRESDRVAQRIVDEGIPPQTLIGILLEDRISVIITLIGILKAHCIFVPLDSAYPQSRLESMTVTAGISFMITDSRNVSLEGPVTRILSLETIASKGKPIKSIPYERSIGNDDAAYVYFTSGSTGTPRAMLGREQSLLHFVRWEINTFNIDENARISQLTTPVFDAFLRDVFVPLCAGGAICIPPDREIVTDAGQLNRWVEQSGITLIHCVPGVFRLLTSLEYLEESSFKQLETILLSGEPIRPPDLVNWYETIGNRVGLVNLWGTSETTLAKTCYTIRSSDIRRERIPVGTPIPGARAVVMDENLGLCDRLVTGELYIKTPFRTFGYLNDPESNVRRFIPDPFAKGNGVNHKGQTPIFLHKTGDLGRILWDGNIDVLGRNDRQVKIRGIRVEPGEIENVLVRHPAVREAAVLKRKISAEVHTVDVNEMLCAWIVVTPGLDSEETIAAIEKYLSTKLPQYMVPANLVKVPTMPRKPNGKIDYEALPGPLEGEAAPTRAPGGFVEKKLLELWSGILGIGTDRIGITSGFFQLGGNSLNIMALISRIHREFDVRIPLAEIFNNPTIEMQATLIRASAVDKYASIEAVEARDYYPQSSAQKRLFFLDKFNDVGTSYNMPGVYSLRGKIDKKRYEDTFNALIQRHESLRTSFGIIDEIPVQRVQRLEDLEFAIEYYQGETVRPDFIRPFELSKAPLLRAGLLEVSDEEFFLLFDMHHIISDGASMRILPADFMKLYDGQEAAPLRIQYKDFSLWQNRLIESGEMNAREEYWLNLYKGGIPRLNLPVDYQPPEVFTCEGARYDVAVDNEEVSGLRRMCGGYNVTLFMNLLAAFNLLLAKHGGQDDIIVGCDVAGRPHADLQEVIGMFVNMLAIRNYPRPRMTYLQFLDEVKENCLEAFENQDVQFENLVDRLEPERNPAKNPLFDVEFLFRDINRALPARNTPGTEDTANRAGSRTDATNTNANSPVSHQYEHKTAKFDMALEAYEQPDGIVFRVEYYTGLFKPGTIQLFANHYLTILRAIMKNPSAGLADLDMMDETEKQRILMEFNRTGRRFEMELAGGRLFPGLFREQVSRNPDNAAVVSSDEWVSYRHLDRESDLAANYLKHETGIRTGDRVGVLMDRSVRFPAVMLGILKAGGVYVPLVPSLPEGRIKTMIGDASIGVVLSVKKYSRVLDRLLWECNTLSTYLCLDSQGIDFDIAGERELWLSQEKLWRYIGETAGDDITGGGWLTSYTGEPFSPEEMDEYGDNSLKKLMPMLHKKMRVLEIGCASGITMYRVAPKVGFYYGTDFSPVIIGKNKEKVELDGHGNIKLSCMPAHDIDCIEEGNFDLVIINSVIQSFYSHNYLLTVLKKAVGLLNDQGVMFAGDIMDLDLKEDLINEMTAFKKIHRTATKTDFSGELFLSRRYFEDLGVDIPSIREVTFSDKIHTIENELTKFRYDVMIHIDKSMKTVDHRTRHKYRHDRQVLSRFENSDKDNGKGVTATPDSLAYMIYTSGTTGRPKGVMVHHGGMLNHLEAKINDLSIRGEDILAQTASAGFDISIWQFLAGLLTGGRTVIVGKEIVLDQLEFLETLQKERITILETVPSLMAAFLQMVEGESEHNDHRMLGKRTRGNTPMLKHLRWMIPTGEALTVPLVRQWYGNFPGIRLVNAYGPTEASDDVTHYMVEEIPGPNRKSIPVGKPLRNLRLYILDENLSLCPVRVRGEICVAGAGVGKGYWGDPAKTAAAFVPNPFTGEESGGYGMLYKTGDIGYWREDGNIECLGRIDHQVKVRGNRIELGEIENRLLNREDIKEAVVVALESEEGAGAGKYLCAYIVPGKEKEIDTTELKEDLAASLPLYMIPSVVMQLETLPLTPNGKIDRNALPVPGAVGWGGAGNRRFEAPRNRVEKEMARIWAEVLGMESAHVADAPQSIGIDDNFFDLGGHSLRATILSTKIHKAFDVKIPLDIIFTSPTIRRLSREIENSGEDRYAFIRPAEKREYYPLSSAQLRLYILNRLEPHGINYNMTDFMELEGEFSKDKIEEVCFQLIRRHESLRTSFETVAEVPVQKVHMNPQFEIEYVEINSGREKKNGEKSDRQVTDVTGSFVRPFDLSHTPLFRIGLIRIEAKKCIFMVDIHHIIADGTSQNILTKEFLLLLSGKALTTLKCQYKDFALWQRGEMLQGAIKKQEEYWLKRFEGEIPVLDLPLDYPRPEVQRFEGQTLSFVLEKEEKEALMQLANHEGATLYMVLLSIFNIFLSKLSRLEDVIVGTPVAGRRHDDLNSVIGMFVNTVTMRNYPAREKTFNDFLREVKVNSLEAFDNQEYQFEELVDRVSPTRDTGRNPLFDTMFALHNIDTPGGNIEASDIGPLKFKPARTGLEEGISKFDLTFHGNETGEMILFQLEYCTKLFKRETVERFFNYFKRVMSEVSNNSSIVLGNIEILDEAEKKSILEMSSGVADDSLWNDTDVVHGLFKEQADKTPDAVAVTGLEPGLENRIQQLTYRELNRQSDDLAHRLRERGVKTDQVVALMMERSIEMVIAILGIMKAGGAYLPVDPGLPEERIDYMLMDSNAIFCISDDEEKEKNNYQLSIINYQLLMKNSAPSAPSAVKSISTNLAYVIYTSGSTGKPKGVMVEHKNLVNLLKFQFKYTNIDCSCLLQFATISFDASIHEICSALLSGGRICLVKESMRSDIPVLFRYIEVNQIKTVFFPMSFLK